MRITPADPESRNIQFERINPLFMFELSAPETTMSRCPAEYDPDTGPFTVKSDMAQLLDVITIAAVPVCP